MQGLISVLKEGFTFSFEIIIQLNVFKVDLIGQEYPQLRKIFLFFIIDYTLCMHTRIFQEVLSVRIYNPRAACKIYIKQC